MDHPSPPALPQPIRPRIDPDPQWRRSALFYLIATVIHSACTIVSFDWLVSDWKVQWGDETFVQAIYLSYGGMLIPAFGKWLFMAILLLYFGATTVLLAAAVAVFHFSKRGRYLKAFAYVSVAALPVGTFAGIHAIRHLAQDASKPSR